jgi:hypothetical protein
MIIIVVLIVVVVVVALVSDGAVQGRVVGPVRKDCHGGAAMLRGTDGP